jgi:arylamine N-acetyltransferase
MPPHLDAYFARPGYTGERSATLAVLRALHLRHVNAIAFDNLDMLLGRGTRIIPRIRLAETWGDVYEFTRQDPHSRPAQP